MYLFNNKIFNLLIFLLFLFKNTSATISISFLIDNTNYYVKRHNNNLNEENYLSIRNQSTNSLFINDTFSNNNNELILQSFDNNNNNNNDVQTSSIIATSTADIYSLPLKIILSTLATATSLITIGGNLLVMCSFFLDRQIRNPTNYFLLSLSVSDFLIGLFSMPLYTLYLMLGVWPFGEVICNLWLSLDYTVCLTSIYTVLFITIDRFCSVKIPAKYRKWRTRRKVIAMITCTWVIPVSLFFTSIFAFTYSDPNRVFNPLNCDVGWSEDKWFNIILVICYFWTTLVVMIILYIFIYQVASNLERKSREKQRKLSSLVGASNNTAAIGGGGVNALNKNKKLSKKVTAEIIKQTDDDEENYNTDSQSTKASKASLKKLKSINKHNKSIKYVEIEIDRKSKFNSEIPSPIYNKDKLGLKNASNGCYMNNKPKKEDSGIDIDKNFAEKESTQNNDASSSFESHSDYDSNAKSEKSNKVKHGNGFKQSNNKDTCNNNTKTQEQEQHLTTTTTTITTTTIPTVLEPRPETLAVMSVDSFTEKCASKQAMLNISNNNSTPIEPSNIINNNNNKNEQIPFIDEDFDDLSYVLHKRQIDKDGKLLIKEETIIIKSPFKQSLIQKLQSPLKNFSRRSLSKIVRPIENNLINQSNEQKCLNNSNKFINISLNETETEKQTNNNTTKSISITTATITTTTTLNTITRSISNSNSDSNTDSNANIYSTKDNNNNNNKIIDKNTNLKKKTSVNTHNNDFDDSEDNYESTISKSHSICNNKSSFKSQLNNSINSSNANNNKNNNNNNSNITKPSLINKLAQINNLKTINNNFSINNRRNGNNTAENEIEQQSERTKRKLKYENRARKALRTITFILGAFVFCFAPWHVVSVWNSFCDKCLTNHKYFMHMFNICYWLCYLNSPINPFMYALANQQFRKTFLRILRRDWRRL